MKYSQPARAASSRRDFSLSDAAIKLIRSPKIRHARENPVGACFREDGVAVARLIVAAADKSPGRHARRLGCLHPADAVLDHESLMRVGLDRKSVVEGKSV